MQHNDKINLFVENAARLEFTLPLLTVTPEITCHYVIIIVLVCVMVKRATIREGGRAQLRKIADSVTRCKTARTL